jgi:hypothetical protein
MDERLPGVEDSIAFHGVLTFMCRNDCGRIGRVWEYPPEGGVARDELAAYAIHFRDVAVGDGAVAGHEEQHYEARVRLCECLNRLAVQIHTELCLRARQDQREEKNASAYISHESLADLS